MGYRAVVAVYIFAELGLAFGQPGRTLTIRVLDYAGVPSTVLRDFDSPARDLFLDAGIDAEWRICRVRGRQGACEPLGNRELYLKIVKRSRDKNNAAFGTTILDGQTAVFSYVFWEKVENAARRQRMPASLLLAHVAAHEVGHLYGLDHADAGLMRRQFGPPDLLRALAGHLRFTLHEGALLRQALRAAPAIASTSR